MNNDNITLDFSKINDMFKTFYFQLYTSELPKESTLMDNFLTLLNIPTLSSDSKNRLDKPIMQEELIAANSSLQCGKSPGPDGFPIEFFKAFSSLLSPQLCLRCMNRSRFSNTPISISVVYQIYYTPVPVRILSAFFAQMGRRHSIRLLPIFIPNPLIL